MQIRRTEWSIGVWSVAVAIAAGLAASGVPRVSAEDGAGNQVFFKGGFVVMNSNRGGEFFTDCSALSGNATCSQNNSSTGWYVGAGLDLVLSKNVWGGMDKTWVIGEIGMQFNRISSETVNGGVTALTGTGAPAKTQLTSVTIDVAPKIKFMEGSPLRPWIIPVGLDIMVISPPSNQTQYLDVGVEFGAGLEYELWKAFKLGLDGRYHLMSNMTNTNNSYGQVGPYVGISF
jgi:opacity protein-like surface antigen